MLKRLSSLLMSICLLLSMVPAPAHAESTEAGAETAQTAAETTGETTEEATAETTVEAVAEAPSMPQVFPAQMPGDGEAVPQANSGVAVAAATGLRVSVLPDKVLYHVGDEIDLTGLELLLTLSSGATQTVTLSDGIALVSGDTSASGRVTVTVSYSGLQASFEVGVHSATTDEFLQDSAGYPQSSHSYANNTDKTYVYTVDGAQYLKLTFSSSTKTESNYDFIYLYNGAGDELGKYTGTELSGQTVTVTGDTVQIRLTSDDSERAYGFSFSSIYAYTTVVTHEKTESSTYTEHTCTADGYYTHTCYICGHTWTEEADGTAAHTMDSGIYTDPTCTADGYTTYTCTVCGETTVETDTGSALGHSNDAGVYTGPDCFADSYTTYTCTVCGATEVVEDTGTAYHVFENGVCTLCGVSDTVVSGGWISETVYWAMLPGNALYIGGNGTVTGGSWRTSASSAASLSFGEGITAIGSSAFYSLTKLTAVRIPDHITSIGSNAFASCTGLKFIYIPSSVASISGSSYTSAPFYGCSSSLAIYCQAASAPGGWGTYWNYRASADSLAVTYGMTEADYLYWSTLDTTATTIVVPDYVTIVPNSAFRNNDTVKVVTLGSGVKTIGMNTFYDCDALKFLYIPAGVSTLNGSFCYSCGAGPKIYCGADSMPSGWSYSWNSNLTMYAFGVSLEEFHYWSSLSTSSTAVTIPDYVDSIPRYAFSGFSSLTSVTIPDSVTAIGTYAFNNCDALASLEVGAGVTSIGSCAFYDCDSLTTVYIPESVQTISAGSYSNSPFNGCASTLTIYCGAASKPDGWGSYWNYYASGSSLTASFGIPREDYLFWTTLDTSAATIVIPEGITTIPAYAFRGCTALTEILIPEGVTTIGPYAFTGCTGLTGITLPASLVSIGSSAFNNCSALTEVHVADLASWCAVNFGSSLSNPLYYGDLYLDGSLVTEPVIPEGVTAISDYTFYGSSITAVTIPASVTAIGRDAFNGCSGLEKVYVSDLSAWCGIAFQQSTANPLNYGDLYLDGSLVTELVIPEDVTAIGAYAFYGAATLTGVTIPSGLTGVGTNAFYNCSGLTYVNIQDLAAWCAIDFASYSANPTYYAKNLRLNGQPITQLVIPGDAAYIGSYTFSRCANLTSVTIPAGVTSIHDGAFYACSGLTGVSIPSSVAEIGKYAFHNCSSLTEILIPEGVTTIGDYAFQYCSALESVQLPDTLTSLGGYAFYSCKALPQIRIPDGVGTVCSYSFANCTALTSVQWPADLYNIQSNAFYSCTGLTEVTFPATLGAIGSYAFQGCTALTTIRFTGDAPSILSSAFASVTADVLYPYDASGWNDSVLVNYGGTLTWISSTNADITAQGTCGDGVTWMLDADGTLLIGGSGTMTDYSVSSSKTTAPWSAYVKSVKVLVVDSGVTYMGKYAFYGCGNLTDIRFLGNKPEFSSYAFYGVRAGATYKANNATWVPSELGSHGGTITWSPVGMSADYLGYSSLTDTYRYWKLDTEGTLTLYNWDSNYTSYGGAPWYPYRHHIKKAVIDGNSVSSIGRLAFYGCTELTDVEIVYNGINTISDYAFQDCTKLKNVILGEQTYNIGKCAFYGCSSLESIFLAQDYSGTIGDYAFGYCTALKEITIPGAATFGNVIFEGCTNLKSIYIGECESGSSFKPSDTTFGYVTANVYYPRNSWSYGSTQGNYGGTLTWIEADFGYCGPDVRWSYDPEAKQLTLSGTGAVCGAYFAGSDLPWGGFNDEILSIVVGEGIEKIPSYTFEYCENTHTILLPETLTSLALNAFNDCGSLNNLILPSSLEYFRGTSNAGHPNFIRCESLTDVYYFGTEEEWALIEESAYVESANSDMTLHFLVLDPGTATCTEPGAQPHYRYDDTSVYDTLYDLDRNEITQLATVPALGHDLGQWTVTKESTCTQAGEETQSCSRCGHVEIRALALAEHSREDTLVAPDCTNQGYTLHVCNLCGDETRDTYVDALGHDYSQWVTDREPTCTLDGSAHRDCSRCDSTESKAIDAAGHKYASAVTDPTCTGDGYTTHTCGVCGDTYRDAPVAALGHSFGGWVTTKDASCTEDGQQRRDCNRCDFHETQVISLLGHKYESVVTAPTCTEDGYTAHSCSVCGDTYTDSTVTATGHDWTDATCTEPKACEICGKTEGDALGHSWDEGVVTRHPTEEAKGECLYTCTLCGETRTEEIPELEHVHSYTTAVTEPTCIGQGYSTHTCRCGDSYVDSYVDALGHRYESVVTNPTCTGDGYTTHTCGLCGDTYTDSIVPATGHDYNDGTCNLCGQADPDYEEPVPEPALKGVCRIAGSDRIATSLGIADQLKEVLGVEKFDTIIVASALNFPDALTGSYLAAVKSAPILLTYDQVQPQIVAYIAENLNAGGTVYILGGESAVAESFDTYLSALGILHKRLAGSDRFGTNLEIMKEAGVNASQEVLICTAAGFADSLSASAAGLPILLVHGSLKPEQKAFLENTSKKFVIIGGTGAVSKALEAELKAIGSVDRLGGSGRYETSVMVAWRFVKSPGAAVLAYARNYPDGLCGGPLAVALNAPLILTDDYGLSAADAYVNGISSGIVVGGSGLISDVSVRDIFDLAEDAPIAKK